MSIRFYPKKTDDTIVKGRAPVDEQIKIFWLDYGLKTITDSLMTLDERAKYLITTCASLIVIHFGIIVGFGLSEMSFRITPEGFFVIAISLFSISYFPKKKEIPYHDPVFLSLMDP
jgi:hypothetical protein